jgi:hypothetical protein
LGFDVLIIDFKLFTLTISVVEKNCRFFCCGPCDSYSKFLFYHPAIIWQVNQETNPKQLKMRLERGFECFDILVALMTPLQKGVFFFLHFPLKKIDWDYHPFN